MPKINFPERPPVSKGEVPSALVSDDGYRRGRPEAPGGPGGPKQRRCRLGHFSCRLVCAPPLKLGRLWPLALTGPRALRPCTPPASVRDRPMAGARWLESREDFLHLFRTRGARATPKAPKQRAFLLGWNRGRVRPAAAEKMPEIPSGSRPFGPSHRVVPDSRKASPFLGRASADQVRAVKRHQQSGNLVIVHSPM